MGFRIRVFTFMLLIAVCFLRAPAQVTSSGSIAGQVVDPTGAAYIPQVDGRIFA